MRRFFCVVFLVGMAVALAGVCLAKERKVELLSRHETVAEFLGTSYHRCMGLTSLCPDRCGHSGNVATFRIIKYLNYEKPGEYGDPKVEQFVFMIADNMKVQKVDKAVRDAVEALGKGDKVLLSWDHNYVTSEGVSAPERPVVKLERFPADDPRGALLSDNNSFAFNFYRQLSVKTGNIFISPASISSALAMTYAGARGETAAQMRDALCLSLADSELHSAFKSFSEKLNKKDNGYELAMANSLWPHVGYKFKDDYIALLRENYSAEARAVDYDDPGKACEIVNKWIEERTMDKIKDLLSAPPVSKLTRLILVNAIYFKGSWESEFDKGKTEEEPFFTAPGKSVKCQMMNGRVKRAGYFEDNTTQALELPYKGGLSMVVVLPKDQGRLEEIERTLDSAKFAEIRKGLRKSEVMVFLPKFTTTVSANLNGYFKKLGMVDAFSRKADFSGMDGTRDLFIQAILHKAFVDVNEEGTEAAAATAVVIGLRSMPMSPPVFRADHPFLFFICGKDGGILFMGRMSDPAQTENNI